MSQFPSMPLFVDAYLADTTHFTAEEHGAYLLLLMALWRRGGKVPDDDRDLARMCCVDTRRWQRVKKRLIPLLIQKDGEFSQKKLSGVLAELTHKKAQKCALDRHTKMNGNNGLAEPRARASAGASRARDLSPSPDTFTDVNVRARALAKKTKPNNSMIEEVKRRMAAAKEDNYGDGYFILPPESHH